MKYYEVAPTRIVRAGSDTFTYQSEHDIAPGHVVRVPVGKSALLGLVIKEVSQPKYTTKAIDEIITPHPLPAPLLELTQWLARYYHTPLATVLQSVLPRGIDKKRRDRAQPSHSSVRERTTIVFNEAQTAAVRTIMDEGAGTTILQGVTGSGKTEIYKELARQITAAGQSVIVLVPEISLTSQLISEFHQDFPDMIVTHSKMGEAERHQAWLRALSAETPQLVIGPRSALFLPVPELGAVIVDEAHEPSYKQEQAPRYSALRAASVLGAAAKARVVFGSATPSISERYVAHMAKRPIIRIDHSARAGAKPAKVLAVDMTKKENFARHRFISNQLLSAIESNLAAGTQTLIFHNRRGSASTTLCESCGWTALCPKCYVPLTLHGDNYHLRCHICGHTDKVPTSCPVCHGAQIIHKGIGTKLIESELRKLFPKARIARFDSDSKADETVNHLYEDLYKGNIDIAIGTQVVAKGLDLPKLRTVGVIQADGGLALPDYTAAERTFQLLAQVVGRVGRNQHDTTVIVQSYQLTHPVIQMGLNQDYEAFYEYGLAERKKAHFPPYTYLLKLTTAYKSEQAAVRAAQALAKTLRSELHPDVRLMGPAPAFYERGADSYRWQLILKSPKREHLTDTLQHVPTTHWQAELDPMSLL